MGGPPQRECVLVWGMGGHIRGTGEKRVYGKKQRTRRGRARPDRVRG